MTANDARAFPTYSRGYLRSLMLSIFRYLLRGRIDPETQQPFDEATIQAATSERTKFWNEADALDLLSMAKQARATWLVDQANPATASDEWLQNYHAVLWGKPRLGASSGGGTIVALATPGTSFFGSTTRPDPTAHKIQIGAVEYQVLYSAGPVDATGQIELVVQALSTGSETNAAAGSAATWVSAPAGADPEGITIPADFEGGSPQETAAEHGKRILDAARHREGAGNQAQLRAWTREATSAVEDAFVYSLALGANSTLLVPVAKRPAGSRDPHARIPSTTVLTDVTVEMVPPGSVRVPGTPVIVVAPPVAVDSDVALKLTMARRSASGWTDLTPWPNASAPVDISLVLSPTSFKFADAGFATPTGIPSLMVWDEANMRFEKLSVASAVLATGSWTITLSSAPTVTLVGGMRISPDSGRRDQIADAAMAYFDSLGPGEVVDVGTSILAADAARFPRTDEQWLTRVSTALLSLIRDVMGSTLIDEELVSALPDAPVPPADPVTGPELLCCGKLGVYPL